MPAQYQSHFGRATALTPMTLALYTQSTFSDLSVAPSAESEFRVSLFDLRLLTFSALSVEPSAESATSRISNGIASVFQCSLC